MTLEDYDYDVYFVAVWWTNDGIHGSYGGAHQFMGPSAKAKAIEYAKVTYDGYLKPDKNEVHVWRKQRQTIFRRNMTKELP